MPLSVDTGDGGAVDGAGSGARDASASSSLPTTSLPLLSTGWNHSCGVAKNGGLKCWGIPGSWALPKVDRGLAEAVPGLESGVVAVAAGGNHTCVVLAAGGVKCWGSGTVGQLGNGAWDSSDAPVTVTGLDAGVVGISARDDHTCALLTGGRIKCWGMGVYGQLGNGSTDHSNVPVDVVGLTGATAVSAGGSFTCAVANGALKCWGQSDMGALGTGSKDLSSVPRDVNGLSSGVVGVAAGSSHTCAVLTDGGVECCGNGEQGTLGDGTDRNSSLPVRVTGLSARATAVVVGFSHSCALLADGKMECWGAGERGQLGSGNPKSASAPVPVTGLGSKVIGASAGMNHTCALLEDKRIKCWGINDSGQLGAASESTCGNDACSPTPVAVDGW